MYVFGTFSMLDDLFCDGWWLEMDDICFVVWWILVGRMLWLFKYIAVLLLIYVLYWIIGDIFDYGKDDWSVYDVVKVMDID